MTGRGLQNRPLLYPLNPIYSVTRNGVTTNYTYQNGNITSVTQNGTAVKTYGYTDRINQGTESIRGRYCD